MIPDSSNLFFAEISRNIEDIGFENGYAVILCNSDNKLFKQHKYLETLISKQVDGIVFISVKNDPIDHQKLLDSDIPMVVVDRDEADLKTDIVLVDNFKGGYIATNHLISLGHKDIACITGPSDTSPSADRVYGYKKALNELGIEPKEDYIRVGNFGFESGEILMEELLELDNPPTAVFVCNDMMAIGAIRTVKNFGLNVPDDISIIGFDNIPISEAISPMLTTISQPIEVIAATAMKSLFSRIKNDDKQNYKRVVLEPELLIRESTKPFSDKKIR